ncbi:MAG: O-methyltransferase [Ignavibacteriaceae bacterium]
MTSILFPAQTKYLEDFRKIIDPLIKEMEVYAKEHDVPILSWQAAEFMEQLIQIIKPKRALEIGTAIGYSSIRIAQNLRKKSSLFTIEISEGNAEVAKNFIDRSEVADKINLIIGDALQVMPQLDKKFDFIFLDADKNYYKRLFDYSLVLLKKEGVIFVDNLLWHGYAATKRAPAKYSKSAKDIKEFNEIFTSQPNLKTTILPIGDGIGLGIKR